MISHYQGDFFFLKAKFLLNKNLKQTPKARTIQRQDPNRKTPQHYNRQNKTQKQTKHPPHTLKIKNQNHQNSYTLQTRKTLKTQQPRQKQKHQQIERERI